MSSSQLFVIGSETRNFVFNQFDKVRVLRPFPDIKISKAFSGYKYSIYTDDNFDNLWFAGFNVLGCCAVGKQQTALERLTPITHFNKHGIKIKNIFVNPSGYGSFFISKDNKVYACGFNKFGQLGIASRDDIYEPIIVPDLENKQIIDIKSANYYSIAICYDKNPKYMTIITNWSRLYLLPQDIIKLIILFIKTTKVFATTTQPGSGHLKDEQMVNNTGWNMVNSFKGKNIIKCGVGNGFSMFLEDNGVIWTCGDCGPGQLGLSLDQFSVLKPIKIPYFLKEKIVITDIKCGSNHNIALDINGDVYSWGCNRYGQCGHGTDNGEGVYEPKLIESVKEFVIDYIDCGYIHSYIKSIDKTHYLFGSNDYGECITYNDEIKIITPFRVDQIIKSKLNAKEILNIELGYHNTKVYASFMH